MKILIFDIIRSLLVGIKNFIYLKYISVCLCLSVIVALSLASIAGILLTRMNNTQRQMRVL